jgi:hypothetical protein
MRQVFLLLGACLLGCGTLSVPPPSPRIGETGDGYYRDGRRFPGGGVHDWELELVQGNVRADSLARKAKWERRGAWISLGLGLVGEFAAFHIPNRTARLVVPVSVLVASVGTFLYWLNRSALDFRDAVNVYNDDVIARERTCAPPASPGGPP